jgi:hypothetical protein
MRSTPQFRPWIAVLLAIGALMPIAICIVLGVGALLSAMGDAAGGKVLNWISLALAILWVLDLVVLVLLQGLNSLFNNPPNDDSTEEP